MIFKKKFELSSYGEGLESSYLYIKLMTKQESKDYAKAVADINSKIQGMDKDNLSAEDTSLVIAESEKVTELMYSVAAQSFVSGEVYDEALKAVRPATKEDVESFPSAVVRDIVSLAQGTLEKKH